MKLEFLVCGLAVLGGTACGSPEDVASSRAAILGGRPVLEPNSIVSVIDFAGGHCSGSLILPNLVLTARHCIAATSDDPAGIDCDEASFLDPDSAGAVFVVTLPEVSDDPADYRAVRAIHLPPDAGTALCGGDVALLVLKQPIETIAPLVPRVDLALRAGEPYSAVGYGVDESSSQGRSGIRRRLDGLEVICRGSDCGDPEVRATEWLGSHGVCPGDSGGPALDALGRVIGWVSRGKDGCVDPIYGSVEGHAAWLEREAIAASALIDREPPNWALGYASDPSFHAPLGAGCSSGTECASNVCRSGACTRPCAEDGPCPRGYTCDSESTLCVPESSGSESDSSCSFRPARARSQPIAPTTAAALLFVLAAVSRLGRVGKRRS